MSEIRNIPLKKSIAIIEKWIDENRENDNETMPQVVDNNDISETNHEITPNNDERSVTVETFEINKDNETVTEVQHVTDDSVLEATKSTGIDKKSKPSKPKRKSKKKHQHNHRREPSLNYRIMDCLDDNQFSDQREHTVAANVEREHGSNENWSGNVSIFDKVNEYRQKKVKPTATVTSHSFEVDHYLHGQYVAGTEPQNDPTDMEEPQRPISVTTNNDENYSRLSNLSYYKVTSENFNGQFTDERVNGVSPNHEREVQYDDDNDQPIDYSVSYQHHVLRNSGFVDADGFVHKNSTVHHTELRTFSSPAASLRRGFREHGFLPYPLRAHVDDHQGTSRSNLYYPAAQRASDRQSFSQYWNEKISDPVAVTTGVAEHTSGAVVETVDASCQTLDVSCQTEIERKGGKSYGGNCCRETMESYNDLVLKMLMQFLSTVAVIANGRIPNCMSSSSAEISSRIANENSSPHSENSSSHSENSSSHSENSSSHNENSSDLSPDNVRENEANAHAEETQTSNIPQGIRKKDAKKKGGVPQKRSQRILDMAASKEQQSESVNKTEVAVPPKKAKSNADGIKYEFGSSASDDNMLDTVPRRIFFSTQIFNVSMETPKRKSKHIPKKIDLTRNSYAK